MATDTITNQVNALATRIGQEFNNYVSKADFKDILDGVANKTYIVKNIPARDALTDVVPGSKAWVKDATGDSTVNNGAAEYLWDGTEWIKLAEAESMDVVLDWDSIKDAINPTSLLAMLKCNSFIPTFEAALPVGD